MALKGDIAAIKEIGDRLEGKAPQRIEVAPAPTEDVNRMREMEVARRIAFVMQKGVRRLDEPRRERAPAQEGLAGGPE